MKICERDKKTFYYALYEQETEIIDEWGNHTGTFEIQYSNPVEMRGSISPAKGNASIEMFGTDIPYSKTIIVEDINCPIDENSVLWIGIDPTTKPYNYIVVKVADGLGNKAYAIKKVVVSAN